MKAITRAMVTKLMASSSRTTPTRSRRGQDRRADAFSAADAVLLEMGITEASPGWDDDLPMELADKVEWIPGHWQISK